MRDYALISGHPGVGNPRTYAGMARDLSTFFVDFNPRIGGLDCFCASKAGSPGKDLRDLWRRRHFADGAGKECRSHLQKDWVC